MTQYSKIQLIKRHMFAMRNGIIADTLRKAGSPFPMIFGMNLPQISETASMFGPDKETAMALWHDRRTRESMLLAPMLLNAASLDHNEIASMIEDVNCTEVADVLCLKLLRKREDALDIAECCLKADANLTRYVGIRLLWNLVGAFPNAVLQLAQKEASAGNPTTQKLASDLVEEARYLLDD
ncbi:MAG: hypothetical protein HDS15_02635 [Bacteroides sp.]|nr:hypothetical protein [Bacteroides sp.]